jgi:hypothetical protein
MSPCKFVFSNFCSPLRREVLGRERTAEMRTAKGAVEKTRNRAGATPPFGSLSRPNGFVGSLPPSGTSDCAACFFHGERNKQFVMQAVLHRGSKKEENRWLY